MSTTFNRTQSFFLLFFSLFSHSLLLLPRPKPIWTVVNLASDANDHVIVQLMNPASAQETLQDERIFWCGVDVAVSKPTRRNRQTSAPRREPAPRFAARFGLGFRPWSHGETRTRERRDNSSRCFCICCFDVSRSGHAVPRVAGIQSPFLSGLVCCGDPRGT